PPAAGGGPRVAPRHLRERLPFVVDVVVRGQMRSGLQHHRLDAALTELARKRATTRAGTDHHDHIVVLISEPGHVSASSAASATRGSGSQSKSLNPRSM